MPVKNEPVWEKKKKLANNTWVENEVWWKTAGCDSCDIDREREVEFGWVKMV